MPMGYMLFEHGWKISKQYRRKGLEKVHQKFPMYRRLDKPEEWTKATFMPGALICLTLRFFGGVLIFIFGCLGCQICSLGHNFDKGPLTGWRKRAFRFVTVSGCWLFYKFGGMSVKLIEKDVDYSEYLGPGYKE